jgi:hypothetical protein
MKQFTVFFLLIGAVLFTVGGAQAFHQERGGESTFRLLAQNTEGNATDTPTGAQKKPADTLAETSEKDQKQPLQKEEVTPQAPQLFKRFPKQAHKNPANKRNRRQ